MTDKINLDGGLWQLELTGWAENALRRHGVVSIRRLVGMSEKELLGYDNIGKRGIADIKERLAAYDLKLGMSESDVPEKPEYVSYHQCLILAAMTRVSAELAINEADRVITSLRKRAKEAKE